MKPKHLAILQTCIEDGCRHGVMRSHKHTEDPTPKEIEDAVYMAVMERIHEFYDFAETIN